MKLKVYIETRSNQRMSDELIDRIEKTSLDTDTDGEDGELLWLKLKGEDCYEATNRTDRGVAGTERPLPPRPVVGNKEAGR